jgi:predicted GIY-YIG superfamily endonuclease
MKQLILVQGPNGVGKSAVCRCLPRHPVTLAYSEACACLKEAVAREGQTKNWSHIKKAALVQGNRDSLRELAKSRN